jgi:hypothetical protein
MLARLVYLPKFTLVPIAEYITTVSDGANPYICRD